MAVDRRLEGYFSRSSPGYGDLSPHGLACSFLLPYCGLKVFHSCQILGRLEPYFFFITAGIKKNRKNMKNINHNVLGGLRNARNERNDKKANA